MNIIRSKNFIDSYNYLFDNGSNQLSINFAGNLDLYFQLRLNKKIEFGKPDQIDFDITKDDYDVFLLFDQLYNDVISCKIYENINKIDKNIYLKDSYDKLVDKNQNIIWVSDEGQFEYEDAFKISKVNDDTYRLTFIRNELIGDYTFKNGFTISVRICNSGSRYNPFNIVFMRFFQNLQEIDPNCRQTHHEEEFIRTRKISNDCQKGIKC